MTQQKFGGDKKVGESVLGPWEKRFVKRHVERVPKFLETYHLTMLTVPWSGLVLLFFWLARAVSGNDGFPTGNRPSASPRRLFRPVKNRRYHK